VSEFRTLVRFGLLVGMGMVASFVASVTLLPAVVAALRPRFVWGRVRGAPAAPTTGGPQAAAVEAQSGQIERESAEPASRG
jgi:hypothetical protein